MPRPAVPDVAKWFAVVTYFVKCCELELELIQTQMTQKPMLRAEVYGPDMPRPAVPDVAKWFAVVTYFVKCCVLSVITIRYSFDIGISEIKKH